MASVRARYLLILLFTTLVEAERYIDEDFKPNMVKALREVSNQTQADTLNLPANASSIRENITDTFSCENRTYGYYADVDNDCQVFHVCLPSQTPSGRNVTYRWSFICPNETVFNQEVLTCTRVADSIDCKDSPLFYHLNMEIGKVTNKTEEAKEKRKSQKRTQQKKKENIVMEDLVIENVVKNIVQEELKDRLEAIEFGLKGGEESPTLIEAVIESTEDEEVNDVEDVEVEKQKEDEMNRLVMERNIRNERQMKRGAFRFTGDV